MPDALTSQSPKESRITLQPDFWVSNQYAISSEPFTRQGNCNEEELNELKHWRASGKVKSLEGYSPSSTHRVALTIHALEIKYMFITQNI